MGFGTIEVSLVLYKRHCSAFCATVVVCVNQLYYTVICINLMIPQCSKQSETCNGFPSPLPVKNKSMITFGSLGPTTAFISNIGSEG